MGRFSICLFICFDNLQNGTQIKVIRVKASSMGQTVKLVNLFMHPQNVIFTTDILACEVDETCKD